MKTVLTVLPTLLIVACSGDPTSPTTITMDPLTPIESSHWARPDHIVSASGFGNFVGTPERVIMTLDARSTDGIASGQLQLQRGLPFFDTAHGTVDCLNVNENIAYAFGTITHSPDNPLLEGRFFRIGVRDGGTGPDDDAAGGVAVVGEPFDCSDPPAVFGVAPWERLSVLVK